MSSPSVLSLSPPHSLSYYLCHCRVIRKFQIVAISYIKMYVYCVGLYMRLYATPVIIICSSKRFQIVFYEYVYYVYDVKRNK